MDDLIPPPSGMAVVRPGDTLLLVFKRNLSQEEAERVAAEFRVALDPSMKVAIFDGAGECSLAVQSPNLREAGCDDR